MFLRSSLFQGANSFFQYTVLVLTENDFFFLFKSQFTVEPSLSELNGESTNAVSTILFGIIFIFAGAK